MESQTQLVKIELNVISDKLETYIIEFKEQNTEGALRVEEIHFNNGETNTEGASRIIINAKLFLDMNKRFKNEFPIF